MLGRGQSFDPNTHAVVRVHMGRLRKALEFYFATAGTGDPIRIVIPKGSYRVAFHAAPHATTNAPHGTKPEASQSAGAEQEAAEAPEPAPAHPEGITVGVMRFADLSGAADHAALAESLSDELTTSLARARVLSLAPRASTFQYRSPVDLRIVGRELGVRYLVDGSVRQIGRHLRVNVQLVDTQSGRQIWTQAYNRTMVDYFAVVDSIVSLVTMELRLRLYGPARGELSAKPDNRASAWELLSCRTGHRRRV